MGTGTGQKNDSNESNDEGEPMHHASPRGVPAPLIHTHQPHLIYTIPVQGAQPGFLAVNVSREGSLLMCQYNSTGLCYAVLGIRCTMGSYNDGRGFTMVPVAGDEKYSIYFMNGVEHPFPEALREQHRELWEMTRNFP
jgi:hypothetical protein